MEKTDYKVDDDGMVECVVWHPFVFSFSPDTPHLLHRTQYL